MTEDCICASLPDLAHIAMGDSEGRDEKFLTTVDEVRRAGDEQWWLYLGKCRVCAQDWLVAQEERIYDEHFLARLEPAVAARIVATGEWPDTFVSYERVLRIGKSLANPCRFLDSFAASLVWTVEDLQKERPDISTSEIGSLLGVSEAHAAKLMAANDPNGSKGASFVPLLGKIRAWRYQEALRGKAMGFWKFGRLPEQRVIAAAEILAAHLLAEEDVQIEAFTAGGFTVGEAHRFIAFLPIAFSRPVLEELGITNFVPTVGVPTADGGEIRAILKRQPEYVAGLALARRHRREGRMNHDVYKAIAGSSAEIDAVSKALNQGADLKGSTIATALVGHACAIHIVT